MSRPLRIAYPGAWYHITNRGRRKEDIFTCYRDYQMFLKVLRETVEMYHLKVSAYCLMPDHYHLLVQTPDGNLSRCMRNLNGVYTQRFNRRNDADGQLFRGRYKAILIEDDNYLLEILRYIHRTPLRNEMVADISDYRYCSHKAYISSEKKWKWIQKFHLLSMLSAHPDLSEAAYRTFIEQAESEEMKTFFSLKNTPSVLGTKKFKQWVRDTFHDLLSHPEVPQSKILSPDPADIIKNVCDFYQVSDNSLKKIRRGSINIPKDVAIYLVRKFCAETLAQIGVYFNMKSYSSVSSAVGRIKTLMPEDKNLRNQIKSIEKIITKTTP